MTKRRKISGTVPGWVIRSSNGKFITATGAYTRSMNRAMFAPNKEIISQDLLEGDKPVRAYRATWTFESKK
jgi:hypothetical protein